MKFFGWIGWLHRRSRIFIWSLFASITVTIGGFAWYMQGRDDASEVTFAEYDVNWGKVPLLVNNELNGQESTVRDAIEGLNRSIGCEVLSEVRAGETPDITIRWWEGMACGKFDELPKGKQGGMFMCATGREIYIKSPNGLDHLYMTRVVAHEFGHYLGLDHDEGGLMAPTINPFAALRLSRPDSSALKGRYCK